MDHQPAVAEKETLGNIRTGRLNLFLDAELDSTLRSISIAAAGWLS